MMRWRSEQERLRFTTSGMALTKTPAGAPTPTVAAEPGVARACKRLRMPRTRTTCASPIGSRLAAASAEEQPRAARCPFHATRHSRVVRGRWPAHCCIRLVASISLGAPWTPAADELQASPPMCATVPLPWDWGVRRYRSQVAGRERSSGSAARDEERLPRTQKVVSSNGYRSRITTDIFSFGGTLRGGGTAGYQ